MLQILRSSAASIVVKTLFVLLIFSFAAWGIQGYIFQAQKSTAVVTVGSQKIEGREIREAFQRDLRNLQLRGLDLTSEQARSLGLLDQTLDRLISGRLYVLGGESLGMAVSDAAVIAEIQKEPAFMDETGKFSRSRFQLALNQAGITEGQLVVEMRRDLVRRELLNSFDLSGDAPMALAKPLNAWRDEKRVVTLVSIPVDNTLAVGEPDDAALEQLYKTISAQFAVPERRTLSFVHIAHDATMKQISLTDEQVRQAYEDHKADFTTPEKRAIQQMRFADEETAKKAAAALAAGQSFEDVARTIAGQQGAELEFGSFAAGEFPLPQVAGAIEALDVGQVSEPVSSDFGWHIFRLSAIEPEKIQTLEEVRGKVEEELRTQLVGDEIYRMSTGIEDALAGGDTLETAARGQGLSLVTVGPLDASGLDADGKPVADLPGGDFLSIAFSTATDERSGVTETPDGGYFVVQVNAVQPAGEQPLEAVRGEVTAAWKADRRHDAAQTRAIAVVERVEKGETLAHIAAAEKLTLSESKPFDRRGNGAESALVTPSLVSDAFRIEIGKAAMSEAESGFVVAQLKEIVPADPAGSEALAKTLGDNMVSDVLIQFNNALRQKYGVTVDEAVKATLF